MSSLPDAAGPAADGGKKRGRKPKPKASAAEDRDAASPEHQASAAEPRHEGDYSAAEARDASSALPETSAAEARDNGGLPATSNEMRRIDTSAEYDQGFSSEYRDEEQGIGSPGDSAEHRDVFTSRRDDSAEGRDKAEVLYDDSAAKDRDSFGDDDDSAEGRDTKETAGRDILATAPSAAPDRDGMQNRDSAEDRDTKPAVRDADERSNHSNSAEDRDRGAGRDHGPQRTAPGAAEPRHRTNDDSAEPSATVGPPGDVIEMDGQRLRRVSPRQMRLQQRKERPPPAEVPEPPVNSTHGDEPDEEELDESRREGVSIGEIEPEDGEQFPDTAGRGPPRTLTDICATYPIGNGMHYIRVERTRPEMYLQTPCAGVLGEITRPMTEAEFRNLFGGSRYELIVYGPDPRGRTDPTTGNPIIKALTKPIHIRVPGNPAPETLTGEMPGRRSSQMFPQSHFDRGGGRLPTSADASIHRDSLSMATNLIREERQEKAALRAELNQGASGQIKPIIDAMKETAHHGTETLRDELRHTRELHTKELERRDADLLALRREIERMRDKPTEAQGAWQALSSVAQSLAPGRSSGEELQRIHDSHTNEMRRLEDQHRREMADARASFDDRLKLIQDQVDKERSRARDDVRDVTDRLERKEKDARESFEQRTKDQRENFEARERDVEARHRAELDRTRGEHERELRSLAQQHELVRTTEKQSQEGRMGQLKDRIDILKEEVERWKNEAARNGDWSEQMAEFEKKAEAAGYQKVDANAPQTWQDRIADAFGQALRNADKIAASVGTAIRDRKDANIAQAQIIHAHQQAQARTPAPGQPQQQLPPGQGQQQQPQPQQQRVIRGPGGRPVQTTRTMWSSEEMPLPPPVGAQGMPVVPPDATPPSLVTVSQPVQEAAAPPPPAPTAPAPQAEAPPPPPPPTQGGLTVDPRALEEFRLWAESEINNKRDPAEFGRAFVERVGVHQAHQVVSLLKIEKLFEALSSTPETLSSPILRRDGQQFMRKAWSEAGRLCRQALGLPAEEED